MRRKLLRDSSAENKAPNERANEQRARRERQRGTPRERPREEKMSEEPFREIVERPEELKDAPFVLPGDRIGSAEEYLPGSGTYEHMGGIYAAVAGRPYYDREQRYTKVFPEMNAPHRIREGDIVIGEVTDIKGSMVMVSIVCLDDMGEREIPNLQPAVIHVSNVKDSYVKELSSEFGYGDIIKARVIDSKNMRLSTEGPELGVLKARCQKCRVPARLEGERLVCPSCGAMLKRKLASGFAQGLLKR